MLWLRWKRGLVVKLGMTLLCLVASAGIIIGSYCNPYWNSARHRDYSNQTYCEVIRGEDAIGDLEYLMKYVGKVHPACYREVPLEVEKQYEKTLKKFKKMEKIDRITLTRDLESVVAPLKDAHTSVANNGLFQHFCKQYGKHNEAGDAIRKVNGMTLREIVKKNAAYLSYETEEWGIVQSYNYVISSEGLAYLGINIEDGVTYTYETETGDEITETVSKEDYVTYEEYKQYNSIESTTETDGAFVSYRIDREHNLAVLQLNECINDELYQKTLKEMFTAVKKEGIKNVAVDLRNNTGGSSSVASEFIRYLSVDSYKEWQDKLRLGWFMITNQQRVRKNDIHKELVFDGNLYVLTSPVSFSSAMNFAQYIKDNEMGKIIGQASSNQPNGYGDTTNFVLPCSGFQLQVSKKKWYRIDFKKGLIEPDILCDSDDAMEVMYEQCNKG